MKTSIAAIIWAVVVVLSVEARANEQSELKEMRKYCSSFILQADKALQNVHTLYEEATKNPVIVEEDSKEAFAFNDLSVKILQLDALVSLAQDVMLASKVEAGIALANGSKPVVFSDSLKRFPGAVPGVCKDITEGFASLSTPELKAIGEKLTVSLKQIDELFKTWPGEFLGKHLDDEPYGTGGLPQEIVRLASVADDTIDISTRYFGNISRAEASVTNRSMDYMILFRQAQRSAITLSVLVLDTYILAVAKSRLMMQEIRTDMVNNDLRAVVIFSEDRKSRYNGIISFYKKQCSVLNDGERMPCRELYGAFESYFNKLAEIK